MVAEVFSWLSPIAPLLSLLSGCATSEVLMSVAAATALRRKWGAEDSMWLDHEGIPMISMLDSGH